MAITESKMMALGTKAPDFELQDVVVGQLRKLDDFKSDVATVVMFICNHCPFVQHVRDELINVANDYIPKDIAFIAICSNNEEAFPEDGPEHMKQVAQSLDFPFPYLHDKTQQAAKDYQAACTPDFYVFDGSMNCLYRGQLDGSRPGNNIPVNGEDLRKALDAILAGRKPSSEQKPSIGCNIKWK